MQISQNKIDELNKIVDLAMSDKRAQWSWYRRKLTGLGEAEVNYIRQKIIEKGRDPAKMPKFPKQPRIRWDKSEIMAICKWICANGDVSSYRETQRSIEQAQSKVLPSHKIRKAIYHDTIKLVQSKCAMMQNSDSASSRLDVIDIPAIQLEPTSPLKTAEPALPLPTKPAIRDLDSLTDEEACVFFGDRIIKWMPDSQLKEKLGNRVMSLISDDIIVDRLTAVITDLFREFIKSTIQPWIQSKIQSRVEVEPKVESKAEPKVEFKVEPKVEAEPKVEPKVDRVIQTQPADHSWPDQAINSYRLPKVMIVGVKADQGAHIKNGLRGVADIAWADKNRSSVAGQADLYVLWTKFISHSIEEAVESRVPRNNIIYFGGGIKSMIDVIKHTVANRFGQTKLVQK